MTRLRRLSRLQQRVMMPRLTRPDAWLLTAAAGLLGFGVVMVLNVSYFLAQARYGDPYVFFRKHMIAVAAGIVVLAPGCASFDEFRDYHERGMRFRALVEAL